MNQIPQKTKQRPALASAVQALAAAWLLLSHFFSAAASLPAWVYAAFFLLAAGGLFALGRFHPMALRILLAGLVFLTAVLWAAASRDLWVTVGLGALILGGCLLLRDALPDWSPSLSTVHGCYWLCGVLLAAFLIAVTVFRYLTFAAPGFDFGIFSQMFAYMRRTGLPLTTYERSALLSHFNIHFSPIYYLMLPLYLLFPDPATLQVQQALIVAAGLYPLYLLCRRHALGTGATALMAGVYLLFPALSGSCLYDLHENCFLTVCLLFVLYGMDADKPWILWSAALLTLCIKEDAAIYLAFLGLYDLLRGPHRVRGAALFAAALAAFLATTGYISSGGDGVMDVRYQNLVDDPSDGMLGVVRTALLQPARLLAECFEADKVQYLLLMLLPFFPLLLCKKHPERYLLLCPMLLLNVLPDWKYQHNIGFQYHFGTTALLLYFALLQLSEQNKRRQTFHALLAVAVCAVLFSGSHLRRLDIVPTYLAQPEQYEQMEQALDEIPEGASVSASTFLTAHLADHEELYPLEANIKTDYVALDLRYGKADLPTCDSLAGEYYELIYSTPEIAIFALTRDAD